MKKNLLILAIVAAIASPSAFSLLPFDEPIPPRTAERDAEIAGAIQSYINGLKYCAAEFFQKDPDGTTCLGSFYMSKETKSSIVITYERDIARKLIVDDNVLSYINPETGKVEQTFDISNTPIYVILRKGLDLSTEQFEIHDVYNDCGQMKNKIGIKLKRSTLAGAFVVDLVFSMYENGNIKTLEGWVITDPYGRQSALEFILSTLSINDKTKIPYGVLPLE